jgi:hypothetical protein
MTNSMPLTFCSSDSGFEKNGSLISDIFAVRSPHCVPQLLCRPHLMWKLGPRKRVDLQHVVQGLDQLIRVGTHGPAFRTRFDCRYVIAHVVHAAAVGATM